MTINNYWINQPSQLTILSLDIDENYRKEMIDKVLSLKDSQDNKTNIKAFMTSWRIWEESKLFSVFLGQVKTLANDIDIRKDKREEFALEEAWGVVYKPNNKAISHNHSPHRLSFVYYLQCDEDSSPLTFPNYGSEFKLYPKNNTIVFFPSYLDHYVPSQKSPNPRIILAGNFSSFQNN